MRTSILIIFCLAVSLSQLMAQTIEPQQEPINFCGNPNYIINTQTDFKSQSYVLGWMWGANNPISKALGSTQSDIWGTDQFNQIPDSTNLFVRSNFDNKSLYCDHGMGGGFLYAPGLVFNPALLITEPITDYRAIAEKCDTTSNKSIFGFKQIHNLAYQTDSGLVLDKTRITGNPIVLQYPWMIRKLDFGKGKYILNIQISASEIL